MSDIVIDDAKQYTVEILEPISNYGLALLTFPKRRILCSGIVLRDILLNLSTSIGSYF
jgi:hypothetical protein